MSRLSNTLSMVLLCACQSTLAVTVSTLVPTIEASGGVTLGPDGALYVSDFGGDLFAADGSTVYRVDITGNVTIYATGFDGASGNDFDSQGNLIQANIAGNRLDRVDPTGAVTPITSVGLLGPAGVVVAPDDTIFVANCVGDTIQKIDPDGTSTVFAGNRQMACPFGLTMDDDGNLYSANWQDGKIIKVTPDRVSSVLASTPSEPGGLGGNAHIKYANGRLYVISNRMHSLYEVTLDGVVTLLAGQGQPSHADGDGSVASFAMPNGIAISDDGRFADINESESFDRAVLHPNRIRAVDLGFAPEGPPLDGAMSGTYAADGLPDQGLSLHIASQGNSQVLVALGLFAYDADGNDMWLLGTAVIDRGLTEVSVAVERFSGPVFLDFSADRADREPMGTATLHTVGCDLVMVDLDLTLGAAILDYARVTGIEGVECVEP